MPRCIYHLEHTQGSGWTPEGEGLLRKRLSDERRRLARCVHRGPVERVSWIG